MPHPKPLLTCTLLAIVLALSACAGKTQFRSACDQEIDAAWSELSIAEAEGFSGTVSYTKAFGFISAAGTMQTFENFDGCYKKAKSARFYIRESRKGQ
ncbi:MAG: hypothetical protein Q7T48_20085 [Cellvibrio sp.]|uniref:hypothetical protein n=1 Tax=Cellvibrio sp. TaxID=1965322 RepID=UPI002716FD90|nr:hypothetical protein [Cellvibrio sp.]